MRFVKLFEVLISSRATLDHRHFVVRWRFGSDWRRDEDIVFAVGARYNGWFRLADQRGASCSLLSTPPALRLWLALKPGRLVLTLFG